MPGSYQLNRHNSFTYEKTDSRPTALPIVQKMRVRIHRTLINNWIMPSILQELASLSTVRQTLPSLNSNSVVLGLYQSQTQAKHEAETNFCPTK